MHQLLFTDGKAFGENAKRMHEYFIELGITAKTYRITGFTYAVVRVVFNTFQQEFQF